MLEHCFICLSARVNSNSNLNSNRFSLVCFGYRKRKEIEEEKEEVNPTQQPSRAQFPFSSSGPTRPPSLLFGRPRTQTQFGPTSSHQARSDFLLFPFPRPTSSPARPRAAAQQPPLRGPAHLLSTSPRLAQPRTRSLNPAAARVPHPTSPTPPASGRASQRDAPRGPRATRSLSPLNPHAT